MRRIASILIIWGLLLGMAPSAGSTERKHVRVVLDVSLSLSKGLKKQGIPPTDKARLAVLTAILLHDLTMFNATSADTFEVIPFEKNWPGKYGFTKIKRLHSSRPKIKAVYGGRGDFVRKLNALPYNAKNAYFYPGLKRAAHDLIKMPGGKFGTRVIVLITGNLPGTWAQQQESEHIRNELVPLFEKHNIRLYVLGFGAQIFSHQSYFTPMVTGFSGSDLGKVFIDPNGSRLLSNMAYIVGRSFGYAVDPPFSLSGMNMLKLNLEQGFSPDRVAVVVLSPNSPMPVPALELEHSSGILVDPYGIQKAQETGASYSLRWILAPSKGIYSFKTNISHGLVAILRPIRVGLEIRKPPAKHKQPLTKTMADPKGIPFDILVRPLYGVKADPGVFEINFRPIIKPPVNGEKKCEKQYGWCGKTYTPPAAAGTLSKEGRVYNSLIKFPSNPVSPHKPYVGHIEISARRAEAEAASLRAANAHPVYIYPYLSLTPFPQNHTFIKSLRTGDEEVCTNFSFHKEGLLPHPNKPKYSLRAVAAPGKNIVANELNEAELTLDGLPLEFESKPVKSGSWWSSGCLLNKTGKSGAVSMGCLPKTDAKLLKKNGIKKPGLFSEHELCIRIGKPKAGSSSAPFTVPVEFTLLEPPYDYFSVVKSFNLKIQQVIAPSLWEVIAPLLWQIIASPLWPWGLSFVLGTLALMALFRYFRNRSFSKAYAKRFEEVTVQPSAQQMSSFEKATPAKILIVTVTKVEVQAILETFSSVPGEIYTREIIGDKTYYSLGIHGDVPIFMVQCEMGIATLGGALLTVDQAIRDLHPQAVIMCGIAFGLCPDRQELGDILIAKQILYYEPSKVDNQQGQIQRGDRTTASARLLDRFRTGDNVWQDDVQTHFGLVLSGEKLANTLNLRERFLKTEPEAVGGEMEGAGLYVAAQKNKVDWILVKAICDWADGNKNNNAQSLAAHNAAQFILHVLQLGGWENPEQTKPGRVRSAPGPKRTANPKTARS